MSTKISEVITSKRAIKALEEEGYLFVEDLQGVPIGSLARIRGVGDVTIRTLERVLGPDAPVEEEVDEGWEESNEPIVLDSPYANLSIRITDSSEVQKGKRWQTIPPKFLRFESGHARLTRDLFFLAKYEGDKKRAKQAARDDEPWRLEAVEWLKEKPAYSARQFIILTD